SDEVAGLEVAAVRAVVRHDLRRAPVHRRIGRTAREYIRRKTRRAHFLGGQRDFELDCERSAAPVRSVVEVPQLLRVSAGTVRHCLSERLQRLRGDYPWRHAGEEVLCEEWAERLILPGLDVARRPVVEQTIAGDMLCSAADRNRLTELISLADPDAEFKLIVEAAAGTIFGRICVGQLALSAGADHRFAGHT